jgi:hypothetical protein
MATTPSAAPVVPGPLPEPLRLPRGSVRGLLAIGLMGTFGYLILQGTASPPAVLVNSVVVVLAFFFGTHGPSAPLTIPPGGVPTWWRRPRIVRGLLLLGFGGLAGWLVVNGLSVPAQLVQVLEVLGGYVLGLVAGWYFHRHVHENLVSRRLALVFRDLSAFGALALTAIACYAFVTGALGALTSDVEQGLSLVITYYFGSRVLAR